MQSYHASVKHRMVSFYGYKTLYLYLNDTTIDEPLGQPIVLG